MPNVNRERDYYTIEKKMYTAKKISQEVNNSLKNKRRTNEVKKSKKKILTSKL